MTLIEIARIYTDLVTTENSIPESEPIAKDEINALRTQYHQILMDKMRDEGIAFSDRFEAMHIAFDLVEKELLRGQLLACDDPRVVEQGLGIGLGDH